MTPPNGLVPTHNPCLVLNDSQAPREGAHKARGEFGSLRMYGIHPGQIGPILEAMRPAEEDVVRATEILLAVHPAGWGPVRHRGEMHDHASYRYFLGPAEGRPRRGGPPSRHRRAGFFYRLNNESICHRGYKVHREKRNQADRKPDFSTNSNVSPVEVFQIFRCVLCAICGEKL